MRKEVDLLLGQRRKIIVGCDKGKYSVETIELYRVIPSVLPALRKLFALGLTVHDIQRAVGEKLMTNAEATS